MRYQDALKEVDMQQNSSEARCTKSDGLVIKPSQPLCRVTRSMTALAAHFLPWNSVKFADYIAIAEWIQVNVPKRACLCYKHLAKALFKTCSKN